MICNTSIFDVDMFKSGWKSVISAIAYAFISFEDDYAIQRAISGFKQCATLAGHFKLLDVFDFVVVSLSQATSLLSDSLLANVPNYPVVDVDGQSVTVSSLSIKFGTNFKGQLAAVVLFNILNGNGNALREGWTQVRGSIVSGRFTHPEIRSSKCSKICFCIRFFQCGCCRWRTCLVAQQ
jgi:golgi-specific brefeldin A-resistance guanine nucleotide exchange factor 1